MTTEYAEKLPDIAWAAAVGAQIAAVLADLHGVDIVHRDIKPANVMIVDGGLVKVLDRPDAPEPLAALVAAMMDKDPALRPSADEVYTQLSPWTRGPATSSGRDPTRPFRTPLLAPPPRCGAGDSGPPLSDAEFAQLQSDVARLLDDGSDAEAVRLLEDGLARPSSSPFVRLELRTLLGHALFYVGEHRRAAGLLNAAGAEYRKGGLPDSHARVLECAYHAGHAYAEIGDPDRALSHLRFYVQHSGDVEQVLESRFVVAQMLASQERSDEALAELNALQPEFRAAYGEGSAHVRSLERQIERLRSA
jgi:hypothetical protein